MRKKALLLFSALVIAATVASPASAQPSADTVVTFTVATSNLVIEVPSSKDLGSGFPGSQISGPLGNIRVVDERAALLATWVASVSSTSFNTGAGQPDEIIPNSVVGYVSGPAVATTGTGTFVPGQPTPAAEVHLNVPRTAFSKTSGSGDNSATWNPTLHIDVPPNAVGGLYVGRVTHSVA
jgi:hypothetical protein